MTRHYSEADLLETYYTQPGESMPVMMHLAGCADCAARYEGLDRKLRTAASCDTDTKLETFWTRQRMSIMRKIDPSVHQRRETPRAARYAAAAVLAFLLGGTVVYKGVAPSRPVASAAVVSAAARVPAAAASSQASEDGQVMSDSWQSDELKGFHSVVQWEGWVSDGPRGTDEGSL